MSDGKNGGKAGDIKVTMGDGNEVGHIGHKTIIFQGPPPDPNAIWQGGQPVGKIGGPPVAGDGTYTFPKLFLDGPFDRGREFSVQGLKLKVERLSAETSVSLSGPPAVTLWDVICRVVG